MEHKRGTKTKCKISKKKENQRLTKLKNINSQKAQTWSHQTPDHDSIPPNGWLQTTRPGRMEGSRFWVRNQSKTESKTREMKLESPKRLKSPILEPNRGASSGDGAVLEADRIRRSSTDTVHGGQPCGKRQCRPSLGGRPRGMQQRRHSSGGRPRRKWRRHM